MPAWPQIRGLLLLAVFAFGIFKFVGVVHGHYPIQHWLIWRYSKIWGLTLLWTLACAVAGLAILQFVLRRAMPILEHLVISFGLGFFSFFLLMFVAGLMHLYGSALFVAVPSLMIAAGAWPSSRYARRLARHLRFAHARSSARPAWWTAPVLLFGSLGTVAVYMPVMLPDNAAFDACWYHMPIAEHYVAAGGIVPFKEGWHLGAFPQLASVLYAWAFLQPFSTLFDRVALCAHLEFVVFLWTLASVPLLVRRVLPGVRAPWSWPAAFLFPGLFVYDSSLVIGADHIAAFWAVPIYVGLIRTWGSFNWRWALIAALFIAAALDTKYTAFSLAVGPMIALVARFLILWTGASFRRLPGVSPAAVCSGFAAFALTGILMTAPHWAKNWAFYGDPMYPALWRHLPLHPWTADAGLRYAPESWAPTRDLAGLWETVRALWTFSFVPNDWEQFHGKVPVFGSLFTLTTLALPFLQRTRRVWGLAVVTLAGVFAWYSISHQDRYLQALLPWMAGCTAALLILAWRSGHLVKLAVVPLVALQLVWGIGVYFIPSHSMLHQVPIRVLTEFAGAWFKKDYTGRLNRFGTYASIGRDLKKHSDVVLVHESLEHLGLRTRTVSDHPRFQSGISYAGITSPRQLWDLYRGIGVTHLLWKGNHVADSYAGDLVFWDFATRYALDAKTTDGFTLARMPANPPTDRPFGDIVALFVCRKEYAGGLYHLPELNVYPLDTKPSAGYPSPFEPAGAGTQVDEQLRRADFIIHDPACHGSLPDFVQLEYDILTRRDGERMYVRRASP